MGFGILPGAMTPEFGNALIVIDAVVLAVFAAIMSAGKIAAFSKLLGSMPMLERFRLWCTAHKGH
ncbi:MAG: hypothetical protein JWN94_3914 [Betaproteobacteria bacterium]|jgi:hypothetical protein|nr:hypothetical protein [Betaproteobacteria bacterium]